MTLKVQLVVKTFKQWLVTLIKVLCFQTLIQPSIFHLQILKATVSWNFFFIFQSHMPSLNSFYRES